MTAGEYSRRSRLVTGKGRGLLQEGAVLQVQATRVAVAEVVVVVDVEDRGPPGLVASVHEVSGIIRHVACLRMVGSTDRHRTQAMEDLVDHRELPVAGFGRGGREDVGGASGGAGRLSF